MLCPNCKDEIMEKLPDDIIDFDEDGNPIYDNIQSYQCMNCGEYDYSL